jgi:hypothetical protein
MTTYKCFVELKSLRLMWVVVQAHAPMDAQRIAENQYGRCLQVIVKPSV